MALHRLKIWPDYFDSVADGTKAFEVRLNDRDYQVGDTLILQEWGVMEIHHNRPHDWDYTGRECIRKVTYVLNGGQFGIAAGHVVMGLGEEQSGEFGDGER